MKRLYFILLALLLILATFAGCGKNADPVATDPVTETATEPEPIMPEIEYTDVTSMMFGDLLGKKVENCGLPQDSVFLEGEYVIGFDYLCMGDITGNVTCYYDENGITSYVFGSVPFDNADAFSNAFDVVNDTIANGLGQDVVASSFQGGSNVEDQMEALFSGSGVIKAEYRTDTVVVTVTGCGVNDVATIVVECSTIRTEG